MANVVISLYYYLLVLKAAYLDEPAQSPPPPIDLTMPARLVAMAMIALIVGLGFYPTALLDLVQAAVLRLP
jgi:NADH-quinone oxidoreductase subunit N